MNNNKKKLSIYAWSLGCPKNRVDTERFLGSLPVPIALVSDIKKADLIFINTCAFIETATRESLDAIFEISLDIQKLKQKPFFIVAGCLPSRYKISELSKEIPDVDLWLDAKELSSWAQIVVDRLNLDKTHGYGRFCISKSYAWLKISDGCQHKCSYCAIPLIKGNLQSTPLKYLVEEAENLVKNGIKEIILVAQDIAAWGNDLLRNGNKNALFVALLRNIAQIEKLRWLRFLYLYPNSVDDKFLKEMKYIGLPLLPYFDLPFQHNNINILKSMSRPIKDDPKKIIDRIRHFFPKAALRATFMVGFPGETEQDFINLCDFVKDVRFNNLGVFKYAPEEGTKAAKFNGQIPEKIKEERYNELMKIQASISEEYLESCLGKEFGVLIDKKENELWPDLYSGHVWFQTPEIDGVTYIAKKNVKLGEFITGTIISHNAYDLGM